MKSIAEQEGEGRMNLQPTDHGQLEQIATGLLDREKQAVVKLGRHKTVWGDGPPYFSLGSYDFWQELAEGRFHLARCSSCQHVYFPHRIICSQCWAQDAGVLHSTNGIGKLVSFTDLHVTSPALKPIAPLRMAIVDLDEGVRVLTWLRGIGADQAEVGQSCKIVVEEILGRKWFVATHIDAWGI
jgi:uncharacterized OB-fold protein